MKHLKIIMPIALLALLSVFVSDTFAQKKQPSKPVEKPLPNLTLNTIDGQEWNLQDQRGSIVLLNVWATWCAPCREEMPVLVRLSERFKEDGVKIFGINIDSENTAQINAFIKDFQINYPVLLTVPGSLLTQQDAVPMSLLIDEKGVLAKKYVGAASESVFEKDIKELLAKKSAPKKVSRPAKTAKSVGL